MTNDHFWRGNLIRLRAIEQKDDLLWHDQGRV